MPGDWWERPSNPPLSLGSGVRLDMGQRCGRGHAGVGHEAVDIVEDIPSWSRDGASRHASKESRDWTDAAVRHQVYGTNGNDGCEQLVDIRHLFRIR